mmetsp:Transcript_23906/g.62086  ORF Transcript_23906/g.62086 Transcript_23906/m.62086 type:complete len:287 (-) Transcript_23906:50-910(-)
MKTDLPPPGGPISSVARPGRSTPDTPFKIFLSTLSWRLRLDVMVLATLEMLSPFLALAVMEKSLYCTVMVGSLTSTAFSSAASFSWKVCPLVDLYASSRPTRSSLSTLMARVSRVRRCLTCFNDGRDSTGFIFPLASLATSLAPRDKRSTREGLLLAGGSLTRRARALSNLSRDSAAATSSAISASRCSAAAAPSNPGTASASTSPIVRLFSTSLTRTLTARFSSRDAVLSAPTSAPLLAPVSSSSKTSLLSSGSLSTSSRGYDVRPSASAPGSCSGGSMPAAALR